MSEWQPLPSGTVLRERYEVEALLGKGGFGATYRARDKERFDQPCALKELLPAKAEHWENMRKDTRGAELLGDRVVSRSVKRYWFTQQLAAGPTLSEFSLQVSTNPSVTFSGARRTFYRWRWMRVPSNDDGRLVSTLEAMRLESGFIPALRPGASATVASRSR